MAYPFKGNPEFSVRFKHCGVSLTVIATVDEADFLWTPSPDRENTEQIRDIFCAATSQSTQQIAAEAARFHDVFLQALERAALANHLASLEPLEEEKHNL